MRRFAVTVRGKAHEWSFTFTGHPEHLQDWLDDGLEVYEVLNCVPAWAVNLGLLRPWVAMQDAWRWLRLW